MNKQIQKNKRNFQQNKIIMLEIGLNKLNQINNMIKSNLMN